MDRYKVFCLVIFTMSKSNIQYEYHDILPFVETAARQQKKHGGRKTKILVSVMVSIYT